MRYLLTFVAGMSACTSVLFFKNGEKLDGILDLLLAVLMLCLAATI